MGVFLKYTRATFVCVNMRLYPGRQNNNAESQVSGRLYVWVKMRLYPGRQNKNAESQVSGCLHVWVNMRVCIRMVCTHEYMHVCVPMRACMSASFYNVDVV
jgi:hypothetical protein